MSSVTAGAVVAFSLTTGRVLSTVAVGETAGPISMIEVDSRRLIAAPSVNDPAGGIAATVSIIDATNARRMELRAILVLPASAQITPATRALLTRDGRFCLIASSFEEPALFSLSVETGAVVSQLLLAGRPSEIALHERGARGRVAVASAVSNSLSLIRIGADGQLTLAGNFSPAQARFDEWNNPAFSRNGRTVYIAAAEGDQLFAVDSDSGDQISSLAVESPQRIAVAEDAAKTDLIGVTRTGRPTSVSQGGATVAANQEGSLRLRSEFTPPDGIEFTRSNNILFDGDATTAFLGSATGMLFAFSVESGEMESFEQVGGELRGAAMSQTARAVAIVRSNASGDEVVIVGFDLVESENAETAPVITSLSPDTVEQGRLRNLRLTVKGENFTDGASLIINNSEIAAELTRNGRALEARLPKSLFDQPGSISVRVKGTDGTLSDARHLSVVRPKAPIIDSLNPTEVPGPSEPFTLKIRGRNFRASSVIFVADKPLDTRRISDTKLQAQVTEDIAGAVARLTVEVRDLAVPDLVSNESELNLFGPRITQLHPSVDAIVAGAGGFKLRIAGENFRRGATVEINGTPISSSRVLRQKSTSIKMSLSGRMVENAGKLAVVVRNPDGSASDARELDALAPQISGFLPGKVLAGLSDVKVNVRGDYFRKRSRVYVAASEQAFRLPRRNVKFRSQHRLVVTLTGELNALLAQPGALRFQVVNPNRSDGVASPDRVLEVAGPQITEALIVSAGDDSEVKLVLKGENFRRGAIVEFIKEEAVVRRQDAERVRETRVIITLRAKRLEALGNFQLRVVNPGNVRSNAEQPRQGERKDDD